MLLSGRKSKMVSSLCHRFLQLCRRDISNVLGEVPPMAFGICNSIAAVPVRCVSWLLQDLGACFFGPDVMPVHVVHVDMEENRYAAELPWVLIFFPGTSHHEDAAV